MQSNNIYIYIYIYIIKLISNASPIREGEGKSISDEIPNNVPNTYLEHVKSNMSEYKQMCYLMSNYKKPLVDNLKTHKQINCRPHNNTTKHYIKRPPDARKNPENIVPRFAANVITNASPLHIICGNGRRQISIYNSYCKFDLLTQQHNT